MTRRQTPRQRKSRDRKRKKRETRKRQAKAQSVQSRTPQARMRRAGAFPLRDCLVGEGWRESRLVTLVISRDGSDGIAASFFLVDLGCLGVKDCFSVPDYSWEEYQSLLDRIREDQPLVACDPALARKLVEAAVEFAAPLGFRPHKDYRLAREIFGDIEAASCRETIPCGDDGKPVYIQGPDDDVGGILSQLEASVGRDGFHYILEGGDPSAPTLLEFVRGLAVSYEWFDEEGDAAASETDRLWRRLRRCEGKLVAAILADALDRYDPALLQEAWGEFTCWDDDRFESSHFPELFPTFVDWLAFSWRPDLDDLILRDEEEGREGAQWGAWPEEPLALEYAGANASDLDIFEQRFLTEMTRPPYSFYAVVRVLEDRGLVLEDVFTRQQVEVRERALTQSVHPGAILFTRVLEHGVPLHGTRPQATPAGVQGIAMVCGCAPVLIPPIYRAAVVDLREQIHHALGRVDVDALHEFDCELRDVYFDIVERLENPPVPKLVNTDGEPLVPTRLCFELRCTPHEALAKLAPLALDHTLSELLKEAEMDDGGELHAVQISWLKAGNRKHRDWSNTVLGSLSIEGTQLVTEVNSQQRAERIRGEIETRLGGQVHYESCVTEPLEMALGAGGPEQPKSTAAQLADLQEVSDAIASLPGAQEQLREHMAGHWEAWLDEPIPALREQTPREAARTPLGRELLEALLNDYESSNRRLPDPAFGPDVAALRRKLGL
jgi:hypothetical protein